MNKKSKEIYAIVTAILFIFVVSGDVVESNINFLKNNNDDVLSCSKSDISFLPEWVVGDSWTYKVDDVDIDISIDSTTVSVTELTITNIVVSVTDIQDGVYTLTASSSSVSGWVSMPLWWGNFYQTTFNVVQKIRSSDLALLQSDFYMQGYIQKLIGTKRWFELDSKNTYLGGYTSLDFPLYVGKSWNIVQTYITADTSFYLYGLYDIERYETTYIPSHTAQCTQFLAKTVQAGTFSCFKIDGGMGVTSHYAPSAFGMIHIYGDFQDSEQFFDISDLDVELSSLNLQNHLPYTPFNPPSGPSFGYVNVPYSFSISTIDPDGDDIQYGWDWYNDDIVDEWTSFSPSGSVVTTQHSWADSGTYIIRAKARDTYGAVSGFSPSKTITIIPNNPPILGTPSPANGSIDQPLSFTWSIPISDPEGDLFDWSIECSNGQSNSGIGDSNGRKSLELTELLEGSNYIIWVNATDPDGSGLYFRDWFIFCTRDPFAGGAGTFCDPYQISDWRHLYNLRNFLSCSFVLINDLDCGSEGYDVYASSSANDGEGWLPLGDSSNSFIGTFDGQNYTISDLYINRNSYSSNGLFGFIINSIISNVGLINASIVGKDDTAVLIGNALKSSITNTYSINCTIVGNNHVGGLIGRLIDADSYVINSYVSNCSVTGNNMVGGFVGSIYDGSVANSYNIFCDVTGFWYTGGFVGYISGPNSAFINNTYSIGGTVNRGDPQIFPYQAGFVGMNYQSKIHNSYSTNSVHYGGDDPTNMGFAAQVVSSGGYSMIGNFWDMQTSGQISTAGNATGKTTVQMMDFDTFDAAGWDITSIYDCIDEIWVIDAGNDYPRLSWEYSNTHKQTIVFNQGWNLISFNIAPNNMSMSRIMKPLIDQGILQIMQDGGTGVLWPSFGIDTIDCMDVTKGYKVKVSQDTQLQLIGLALQLPENISLMQGWNLIGYPSIQTKNAITLLQDIISKNVLIQVIDENDNKVYHDGDTWINEIGDFQQGKGYYVKVTTDSYLNIIS